MAYDLILSAVSNHFFFLQRIHCFSFFFCEICTMVTKIIPVQQDTKDFLGKSAPKLPHFEEKNSEAMIFRQ
jgi:hypothetical protein